MTECFRLPVVAIGYLRCSTGFHELQPRKLQSRQLQVDRGQSPDLQSEGLDVHAVETDEPPQHELLPVEHFVLLSSLRTHFRYTMSGELGPNLTREQEN